MSGPGQEVVDQLRAELGERYGLALDPTTGVDVVGAITERMRETGHTTASAYLRHLQSGARDEELYQLAELLRVGETYFFRQAEQLEAFIREALPARMAARQARRELRILSAGCATGEEPHTLAILLDQQAERLAGWKTRLVGVDLSARSIEIARRGRYSGWSLRQTAPAIRGRYFRAVGQEFELDAAIRERVTFAVENLADPAAQTLRAGDWDVVFCRNVVMYLRPAAAAALVERLAGLVAPGGYLFLGNAETLRGLTAAFHVRHDHGAFYYQRRDVPEPRSVASADWADRIARASQRISGLINRRGPDPAPALAPRPGLGRAIDLVSRERYDEAREMLRELLAQGDTDIDAQLLLAVVLTNQGLVAEAEAVCARVLELDELNAGAHYLRALCREHEGDREGAIRSDQLAIHLDPSFAMPRLHLGLLYRRAGRVAAARAELETAKALLPREDAGRVLMFGGGFRREALIHLAAAELRAAEER